MSFEGSSIEIKPGSNRNFGVVFAIVFAIVGVYPALFGNDIRVWSLAVSLVFVVVTVVKPSLLAKPNYWWFRFGMLLGAIIAPIVMGLVYLSTVVPTGLLLRLFGKDLLRVKPHEQDETYWIERDTPPQPMKNQF
jgi:hypothetical protein